ncbi:hybrid sensor histidine kinase/response regulator [Oleiagrimonas citrea]|uniref:histidine kinase n=1 Tax=Oleiagrimonas citrea TaxID=1665687 RepID=A0A846ZNW0_9GAMM|nr:hybrid sensor histidine kinase/response regulator [Oleiagrimonas citrea]NKZ39582.1 hybrid sensor histidine kinase/response regulator [Oleiagrimonas citrea]
MSDRAPSRLSKWWRRASLVQRLVLVALVPSVVSTMFLAILLTRHQIGTLQDLTRSTASAYMTQAAVDAAPLLRNRNLPELRRLARSIGRLPHVNQVRILDGTGRIIAAAQNPVPENASLIQLRQDIAQRDTGGKSIGTLVVHIDTEASLLTQYTDILDTLLWVSIAILLAILLSWQQARWISAPLRRLSVAMGGLGRFDHALSVEVTDDSEIGELQRGFNKAAASLHTLHRDMERRIENATQELAHKNDALEQASKAKARFLASATHDLRQPLYALTLFSSSLAEQETQPERLDRISHVQQCIESLDRLFSELLDLSRLEAGAMQPELRDFPLDELFQEVSRNFRIQAEKQELRLITRPTPVWVHSDRTMLARILNNLVSNALRYTREGGVLVGARLRGDRIRIDVRDTGIGIPEEHQAHIFEEFYRVDSGHEEHRDVPAQSGSQRGLGLGLSTVQRLAELLGTEVELRSHPGRGTLFTLLVRRGRSKSRTTSPIRNKPRALPRTHPSLELKDVRVMVVDDDQAILAGMHDLLRSWGCKVRMATDCDRALEQASRSEVPDIVISDLHLGTGRNGVETLHALAEHYGAKPGNPPFARLLVTGETERSRLQPALKSGVPILFKPVASEPLREAIITLLRTRTRAAAISTDD